ncbi:hypothetical protein K7432_013636 [Basidiobolus ranarum]|uniref:Uncharacterized protein n=1 Tax=Basidiobolus ranarum TaxID=34480 RepID=A0ABR2WIW3_9FUNG
MAHDLGLTPGAFDRTSVQAGFYIEILHILGATRQATWSEDILSNLALDPRASFSTSISAFRPS